MRDSQREGELRELVITGLAHLVSANTESGFKQCLPLAYDKDSRKRTIFAHVFARVLSQGTKFDPEDRSASLVRHNRLSEVCCTGQHSVLAWLLTGFPPWIARKRIGSRFFNHFCHRVSV
jgi:hypothetical protein